MKKAGVCHRGTYSFFFSCPLLLKPFAGKEQTPAFPFAQRRPVNWGIHRFILSSHKRYRPDRKARRDKIRTLMTSLFFRAFVFYVNGGAQDELPQSTTFSNKVESARPLPAKTNPPHLSLTYAQVMIKWYCSAHPCHCR